MTTKYLDPSCELGKIAICKFHELTKLDRFEYMEIMGNGSIKFHFPHDRKDPDCKGQWSINIVSMLRKEV